MGLSWIFSINQDIIQVYHNKDIKLFSENFIVIALKAGGYDGKAKGYYLVLELAVSGAKVRLPLVTFSNPYLVVSTSKIELDKFLGPA